jgi:hypothetical protein
MLKQLGGGQKDFGFQGVSNIYITVPIGEPVASCNNYVYSNIKHSSI